uniref:Uncharacterized protein n=1 Tax=Solanum lycopersicum TaxID=4081 RepID=K4BAI9_SOLLC
MKNEPCDETRTFPMLRFPPVRSLTGLKHLLGITKEVGNDPGLPEALRARMLALEDEVNMVMGQYLGAVEGHLRADSKGKSVVLGLVLNSSRAQTRRWWLNSPQSSGAERHLTVRKGASKTILVNAIRTGCSPQQSALPMLLSA